MYNLSTLSRYDLECIMSNVNVLDVHLTHENLSITVIGRRKNEYGTTDYVVSIRSQPETKPKTWHQESTILFVRGEYNPDTVSQFDLKEAFEIGQNKYADKILCELTDAMMRAHTAAATSCEVKETEIQGLKPDCYEKIGENKKFVIAPINDVFNDMQIVCETIRNKIAKFVMDFYIYNGICVEV
jgi:hypothetical protein